MTFKFLCRSAQIDKNELGCFSSAWSWSVVLSKPHYAVILWSGNKCTYFLNKIKMTSQLCLGRLDCTATAICSFTARNKVDWRLNEPCTPKGLFHALFSFLLKGSLFHTLMGSQISASYGNTAVYILGQYAFNVFELLFLGCLGRETCTLPRPARKKSNVPKLKRR